MNNIKLFIKYEDDILSKEEKAKFEIMLEESNDLQKEYNLYKERLGSLSTNIDVDEQYFVNLLPNVRSGMDKQKSFQPSKKIVYAFPVVLLAIFLTFQLGNNKSNGFDYNFNELISEFSNEEDVMNELFADALSSEDLYYSIENNFEEYGDEDLDNLMNTEIQNENLEAYIYEDTVDEDFVQNFSDDQFDEVYTLLLNKKF
ncbi:MAG: hypothetical protein GY936_16065 [Ignavibacteriae bacterium]|nr:hypothetical protein [Ignavibacteriota bacterium]